MPLKNLSPSERVPRAQRDSLRDDAPPTGFLPPRVSRVSSLTPYVTGRASLPPRESRVPSLTRGRASLPRRESCIPPPPAPPLREAVRRESGLLLLLCRSASVSEKEDHRNSVCNEQVDLECRPVGAASDLELLSAGASFLRFSGSWFRGLFLFESD